MDIAALSMVMSQSKAQTAASSNEDSYGYWQGKCYTNDKNNENFFNTQ